MAVKSVPTNQDSARELGLTTEEQQNWDLSPAVDALGTPAFARALLVAFNRLLAVDHLVIIRIDRNLTPQLVATESQGRDPVAQQAGDRYLSQRLYHADPNVGHILARADAAESPLVTHLLTAEIGDATYRQEVFEKSAIVARVSFIDQRDGRWFMTNLYRDKAVGVFDAADLALVTRHARLVSALVAKHISLAAVEAWTAATRPPVATLERSVRSFGASLSEREVEVCARALLGLTSEAIGLDLGVKATTITTHRKRAYAKLGISRANELFALCLGRAVRG